MSALLRAQDEIGRTCGIRVGIGVHLGDYYDLDGGLYGAEADAVEHLAENHTEGGEIVVTEAVAERLPAGHGFVWTPDGGCDVAGAPVNQASKMAQDLAVPGVVCLSEAVAAQAGPDGFTRVRHTVSGVDLTFYQG